MSSFSLFTRVDDRGVAHTLDALLMVVVLGSALLFAAQNMPASGTTEFDESMTNAQLEQNAADVLAVAHEKGTLKDGTLYWDESAGTWVGASGPSYTQPPSGHPLRVPLNQLLSNRGASYLIEITYQNPDSSTDTRRMFYQGTPGGRAVVAEQTVTLSDDDNFHGPDSGTTVGSSSSYFAPDAFPGSNRYNILRVRLLIWRS